jgi:methionyl aminopeptidase
MAIMQNKQEKDDLKHSCLILMSCYNMIQKEVKEGVQASKLDKLAETFIRDHGGVPSFLGYQGFKYSMIVSLNEEVVHGLPTSQKYIPEKALVSLDMGVIYKGMFSDSAKTYVVGDVGAKALSLVEGTQEALAKGIAAIKDGCRVGDIGYAVDSVAKKYGFGNVLDLGGHGVGKAVHEEPYISNAGKQGKGARLFENQVVAIEPMFTLGSGDVSFDETKEDGWTVRTIDGSWAAHFEHTVMVTKKGVEILTEFKEEEFLK